MEVEKNLPCPERHCSPGPVDSRSTGRARSGMRVDLSTGSVDRDDNGLRAETVGELPDQRWTLESCRVDGDLVGAGLEQRRSVIDRANAAADRERNRKPICNVTDQPDERRAPLDCRFHVEEYELIRTGVGVRSPEVDRVADVAEAFEAHPLHNPPAGDVQAGDQARERHRSR